MTKELFISAITKFAAGVLLVGLLIFVPAGTIHFPGGQLLMAVLFLPMFLAGIVMMLKNPALLRSRLKAKEKEADQDLVIKLSGLMFLVGFILAGLDFRFGWSNLPRWVSTLGAALFLSAYALFAEVLRENTWLSRTIEVQEGQTVVSTGLYGIVRHPMYLASVLMFLSIPLVMGSWYALIPFAFYPLLMVVRILDEEKLLTAELSGYEEYKRKVKFRLIPFIW